MAVLHSEISEGIDRLVGNPDIRALYRDWQAAPKLDGLPDAAGFDPDQRPTMSDRLMVLVPETDEFRYRHYGRTIVTHSGFDMTGRSTGDFGSPVGRFFRDKYREALAGRRPLYTIHHAELSRTVVAWERLILPVRAADGTEMIVCYNVPLEEKAIFFDTLMEASLDGIVLLRPMFGDDGEFVDMTFAAVNRRAEEILARGKGPLVGSRVLRDFFQGDEALFASYRRVWTTGEPARFDSDHRRRALGAVFRVSAARASDKLIVTFADITPLVEANEELERQRVELTYQNEVLNAQAADLARTAEDAEEAKAEARNAERFVADLLEAVPIPVFFKTKEDRVLQMVNRRYADLYGLNRHDLVGRTLDGLLDPEVLEDIDRQDRKLYEGGPASQIYETDLAFPAVGMRRMVLHKAKMRDADNQTIGVTGVMIDVTEAHRLRQELERLATTDPLTGLSNRRVFLDRAHEATARAVRHDRPVSVVMIDIDHFKSINDSYGHEVGDRVLMGIASAMREALRHETDLVARFGGEEFAILLPETSIAGASLLAERLRIIVENLMVETERGVIRFTASFGVETFRRGIDLSIETVLKRADDALYRAKGAGRNRVRTAA